MRRDEQLACGVVRFWTRMYTSRLAPEIRDPRRAEIESDLWEHLDAPGEVAMDRRSVAGQIVARCLLGLVADLTWRSEMVRGRRNEREGDPMNERIKRDWWIPAPIALIGFGALIALIHFVGDGFESEWSHTVSGWNPSLPERGASVIALGFFFLLLPIWALVVRRGHPGWTVVMLMPWILWSLVPLMWAELDWLLVLPALGIVTLVGAVMNLAQLSVVAGPPSSTSEGAQPSAIA